MPAKKSSQNQQPDIYLQLIEDFVQKSKGETSEGKQENEEPFEIKVVSLEEFEKKIQDDSFVNDIINTLKELYEWKKTQYKSRIFETKKQYEKDERIIKSAKLSPDELKELGMATTANLKVLIASLNDTLGSVENFGALFIKNLNPIPVMRERLESIIYDSEKGLRTLVGKQYKNIKTNICTLISSLSGGMNTFTKTFQNIVITGPAGVGKTTLAKYLAFYYHQAGILATDIVSVITRPDLVGQYLGETGMKTKRKMIDSLEGIIFIDEAYQLGGCPESDAYGMESITEIVNFLDKYMALSIVIVAGYENEMNQCFFERNEGLRRRFPNQFKLIDYEFYDLFMIFMKGCYKDFYKFYSGVSKSTDAEIVFKVSANTLEGIFKSFQYLNQQECQKRVYAKDEDGQFILSPDGRKTTVNKKVKCYFPNQGGDVGILVSKFYNYFYSKNVPAISFIGGIKDLGTINIVASEKNQEKVKILKKQIIDDINAIGGYFNTDDINNVKFPTNKDVEKSTTGARRSTRTTKSKTPPSSPPKAKSPPPKVSSPSPRPNKRPASPPKTQVETVVAEPIPARPRKKVTLPKSAKKSKAKEATTGPLEEQVLIEKPTKKTKTTTTEKKPKTPRKSKTVEEGVEIEKSSKKRTKKEKTEKTPRKKKVVQEAQVAPEPSVSRAAFQFQAPKTALSELLNKPSTNIDDLLTSISPKIIQ